MRAGNLTVAFTLVAVATAAPAVAQGRIGSIAVASWAGVAQQDDDLVAYDTSLRWGGGVHVERALGGRTALVVETLLVDRGARGFASGSLGGGIEGSLETDVRLRYIEDAALFRWDALSGAVRPYLAGGLSLGYLEDATVRTFVDGGSESVDVTSDLNRFDVGLLAAAGVSGPLGKARWFVEGRFCQGLLNLDRSGETHVVKYSLDVSAGFTVAFGGRS